MDKNINFSSPEIDFTEVDFVAIPRNNVTFTTIMLSNGQWYWRVRSINNEGTISDWVTATNGFRVDINLPRSSILYPQDKIIVKKVDKIIVGAIDDLAIDYVQISFKNIATGLYYNGTSFTANTETWLMTKKINGRYEYTSFNWNSQVSYIVRSRAIDTEGNEEHIE